MKPLIETLRTGQKAKLATGEIVWRTEKFIKSETTSKISNVDMLMSTDYEIIEDKAWEPTSGDKGWVVDCQARPMELQSCEPFFNLALPTKQAAEHKAKIDRIITAIMRMPGYGGDGAHVYFCSNSDRFCVCKRKSIHIMEYGFDTYENAKAAADVANNLVKELS